MTPYLLTETVVVFLLALVPEISTPLPDLLYTGPMMPWYRTGKLLEIAT